jgi:hypothetical protein
MREGLIRFARKKRRRKISSSSMGLNPKRGMPGWLNLGKILIEGQASKLCRVLRRSRISLGGRKLISKAVLVPTSSRSI